MRKLISLCMVVILAGSAIGLSGCCCKPKHQHEHGTSKVHHEHGDK